jgi:thiol-disulfide isomerase/thioredoxin
MRATRLSLIVSSLAALAAFPAQAETFRFHVIGIECQLCAVPIQKALASTPGVERARVDWKKETAEVDVPPAFDKTSLKFTLDNLGFVAVFPGETAKGFEPLTPEALAKLDIRRFDGKRPVDEKELSAQGKTTLIDYYADWCGPCKTLELRLERYMTAHSEIALRRVDIGKWDNAAARQITRQGAAGLPYVRVYDGSRTLVGNGGMWDEILALTGRAKAASR